MYRYALWLLCREIKGKKYPGNVKEKHKARQEYLHSLQSGSSAGLVEERYDISLLKKLVVCR